MDRALRSATWKSIIAGGLACGVLDIIAACVQSGLRGVSPPRVFRAIASGVMGPSAFQGGAGVAALGLFLHFVIAFGAATVFVLAARRLPILLRHAVLIGAAYGIAVHLVMKFIVVPSSGFPSRAHSYALDPVQVLIHVFFVGLPIALAARHYLGAPQATGAMVAKSPASAG